LEAKWRWTVARWTPAASAISCIEAVGALASRPAAACRIASMLRRASLRR
jgi:hypothetical protein